MTTVSGGSRAASRKGQRVSGVCNSDRPQWVGQHEGTSAIRFGNPSESRRVTAAGWHDVEKELTTWTYPVQIERTRTIHCM